MRSKFTQLFAAFLISCFFVHQAIATDHAMGVHGMVLFSDGKQLFASHLPLLHPPHDYQVVVRLRVDDAELNHELVSAARHNILTIEPERFELLQLKPPRKRQEFNATVFDGHFERFGRKRLTASFLIDEVLLFEQIIKNTQNIQRYIVFPHAQGSFLLHQIKGKGDFDQILDSPNRELPHIIERNAALTLPSNDPTLTISRLIWWETQDLIE